LTLLLREAGFRWPDPRCEDRSGPLAASSVSWLVPRVFSRGQAIRVGLTSTRLSRINNANAPRVVQARASKCRPAAESAFVRG
jgi:hypothetical protein